MILARNPAPLGMMGSSLGGYTSALLASLDDRLDFVIPILPPASITDSPSAPERSPIAAMRSPLVPRSARTAGAPVPSTSCPFLMRRSNFMALAFPRDP